MLLANHPGVKTGVKMQREKTIAAEPGLVRLQRNRPVVSRQRLVEQPLALQRAPEVVMRFGMRGRSMYGSS